MNPKDATLSLILQLTQFAVAEIPNVAGIVALLRNHTLTFEQMLSDAERMELAEIEKLKEQSRS